MLLLPLLLLLHLSPSEHDYTESNLRFEHFKGADRTMLRALSTCNRLDAHLVLVTRAVCGQTNSPCYGYKRRRCWGSDDDDDSGPQTMGEVRAVLLLLCCLVLFVYCDGCKRRR
jgi:hypothetical protein